MNIKEAFEKDGYTILEEHTLPSGASGYMAESKTVKNSVTGEYKRAFYLSGGAHDMGYLTGYMSPDAVNNLVHTFPKGILREFLDPTMPDFLCDLIYDVLKEEAVKIKPDLPEELWEEMHGVAKGAKKRDSSVKVTGDDILTVNVGFDILTATAMNPLPIFTKIKGDLQKMDIHDDFKSGKKSIFKMPVMCHAYSVFGNATTASTLGGKNHYFAREFQFPTGNVFQDTAALMIFNPDDGRLPLVAVGAPGFVGSITAMNKFGVAMGVDTVPASNADHNRIGVNSLLLVRHGIHNSESADKLVEVVQNIQRGVPWIYPFADGTSGKAGVMEVGMSTTDLDPWEYVDEDLIQENLVPDQAYMDANAPELPVNGMMVRWSDYKLPFQFITDFNPGLFGKFGKTYDESKFGPEGFLFPSFWGEKDGGFGFCFFPPQRESYDDVVIVSNQWFHPRMRLCEMNSLLRLELKKYWTDFQWRYDSLNKGIVENYGSIDFDTAWTIINIINPNYTKSTEYQQFYGNPLVKYDGGQKETYMIFGATAVADLKEKKIRALYGYYADEPLELHFDYYLDGE